MEGIIIMDGEKVLWKPCPISTVCHCCRWMTWCIIVNSGAQVIIQPCLYFPIGCRWEYKLRRKPKNKRGILKRNHQVIKSSSVVLNGKHRRLENCMQWCNKKEPHMTKSSSVVPNRKHQRQKKIVWNDATKRYSLLVDRETPKHMCMCKRETPIIFRPFSILHQHVFIKFWTQVHSSISTLRQRTHLANIDHSVVLGYFLLPITRCGN